MLRPTLWDYFLPLFDSVQESFCSLGSVPGTTPAPHFLASFLRFWIPNLITELNGWLSGWCAAFLANINWRCASFDSMTPAKKNARSAVYFLRRQPRKFDIVTLVAHWRMYFPVFFGDFLSPFIFTKTSCLSVNQFHIWRHVGTYIYILYIFTSTDIHKYRQIYIFTSTDVHVWYQHVDQ